MHSRVCVIVIAGFICWASLGLNAMSDGNLSTKAGRQERDENMQSCLQECKEKGIEEATALQLIGALESTNTTEAIKAIQTLGTKKMARPIARALRHPHANVKLAAIMQLAELKDSRVTYDVVEALERHNYVQEGSEEATAHQVIIRRLISLLSDLTETNYKLDNPNNVSRVQEIVKSAKEKIREK